MHSFSLVLLPDSASLPGTPLSNFGSRKYHGSNIEDDPAEPLAIVPKACRQPMKGHAFQLPRRWTGITPSIRMTTHVDLSVSFACLVASHRPNSTARESKPFRFVKKEQLPKKGPEKKGTILSDHVEDALFRCLRAKFSQDESGHSHRRSLQEELKRRSLHLHADIGRVIQIPDTVWRS